MWRAANTHVLLHVFREAVADMQLPGADLLARPEALSKPVRELQGESKATGPKNQEAAGTQPPAKAADG
eukprot:15454845-Alexandrium_andersonii.AAC.1